MGSWVRNRAMFENLKKYSQISKINVFDIVPLTYVIDVDTSSSNYVNSALSEFTNVFNTFEANKQIFNEICENSEIEELDEKLLDRDLTIPDPEVYQQVLILINSFSYGSSIVSDKCKIESS